MAKKSLVQNPWVLVGAGAVGGALLHKWMSTPTQVVHVHHAPSMLPAPQEAFQGNVEHSQGKNLLGRPAGVSVRGGKLRIDSWEQWMEYAPDMVDLAVHAGASTAGEVLKVVLDAALPSYPWPPPEGSRLREQWDMLADVIADSLELPNPPPDDGVEEDVPLLRLVK